MLISPDRRMLVSNLGWADKGGLWTYDAARDSVSSVPLGDAKYLSLFECRDPANFAVLHHYDSTKIRLSVHFFEDPAATLCSLERNGDASILQGDAAALQGAPTYYTAYFKPDNFADYHLLTVDIAQSELRAERFIWFGNSYDRAYQGIVGVLELPSGNLIVSVQRDSYPLLYNPRTQQVVRRLSLANRGGNPALRLLIHRREL